VKLKWPLSLRQGEKQVDIYFIGKFEVTKSYTVSSYNHTMYLSLTVSVCKHKRLSDSLQAELEAAAEEAGTDIDTLRNKVELCF